MTSLNPPVRESVIPNLQMRKLRPKEVMGQTGFVSGGVQIYLGLLPPL